MATDNTVLLPGSGGDTIRDIDKGGAKTQVVIQDYGGAGAEDLTPRDSGSGVVTSATPRTVEASNSPLITAVDALLTNAELRATPIDVVVTGGGGGAVTIADGADVTQGAIADAAVSTDTTGTLSAKLRGVVKLLASVITGGKVTVDGSSVTQPVSAASLPLPANAAQETGGNLATIAGKDFATQTTLALIKAKTDNIDVALSTRTKPADQQHVIIDSSASIAVTGPLTDVQLRATPVPISATDLDIRDLAFATDKVDASGSSVTANAGTNLNTSLLALESGGNLAAVKTNTDTLVTSDAGGYVRQDSTATIAKETGGNLDAINSNTESLTTAQGATSSGVTGPIVQVVVSDTAASFTPETVQPLQVTSDGRLRVVTLNESYNFTAWGSPYSVGDPGLGIDNYPLSAW